MDMTASLVVENQMHCVGFSYIGSPPFLDDDLCFPQVAEYFTVEQFISEPSVEALAISIFPSYLVDIPWYHNNGVLIACQKVDQNKSG